MKVYKSIALLRRDIIDIKKRGRTIGFVPTMGYLHEGHLSLIRQARRDTDCVVVSIFVNPIQFGPREDFKRYPRDLNRDVTLCRKEKVDIVFVPGARIMYPDEFSTYVDVERLTEGLCGASRPGHFRGVTTVVAKLFNIVMPDIAYFGQKDAQQAIVVKRMVKDLNMPVTIKVMPIVREKDGLAMSSRNAYLTEDQRKQAVCLYKSLMRARQMYKKGERNTTKIVDEMRKIVLQEKDARIDYISIVDLRNLKETDRISGKVMAAMAVWIGNTRLIDNILLK